MGYIPTVGGDFLFCRENSEGERKGDSDPSVTLLALLGFSTLVGGRPGIQK